VLAFYSPAQAGIICHYVVAVNAGLDAIATLLRHPVAPVAAVITPAPQRDAYRSAYRTPRLAAKPLRRPQIVAAWFLR
jgi:hypothetical protein